MMVSAVFRMGGDLYENAAGAKCACVVVGILHDE